MSPDSIPPECIEARTDSKISLKEKKCRSQIVFQNDTRREILVITVDNCAIKEGDRCDYLITDSGGNPTEHYVELKGRNVKHAVEQIKATIEKLSRDSRKLLKNCWIICTQNPLDNTQVQRFKVKFFKDYNAILKIHRLNHIVKLS